MRYRTRGLAFRRSVAAMAVVAGAVALSGCSSIGSRMLFDQTSTGSVNTATTAGYQSMPAPVATQVASNGRYVPPADIGRAGSVPSVQTAAMTQASPAGAGINTVRAQQLPPLTSSGSTQAMPAQPAVSVASAPAPANVLTAPRTNAPATLPVSTAAAAPTATAPAADGMTHKIVSGESLYVIARRYGVTTDSIVHANELGSPDRIFVGQEIIIPGVRRAAPAIDTTTTAVATAPRTPAAQAVPAKTETAEPVKVAEVQPTQQPAATSAATQSGPSFRWPLSGTVITDFASSRSGINIAAQEGTAVRAVDSGEVIYTGSAVQGYGNLILIKHTNGYVSAYAHLKDISIAKGDMVARGDAIGTTGMTGGVSRPQLHFELRKGATPVDPEPLLAS